MFEADVVDHILQFPIYFLQKGEFRVAGAHAIASDEEIVEHECATPAHIAAYLPIDGTNLDDGASKCTGRTEIVEQGLVLSFELPAQQQQESR